MSENHIIMAIFLFIIFHKPISIFLILIIRGYPPSSNKEINLESGEWLDIGHDDVINYRGMCFIAYKGRVVVSYRDSNHMYRFINGDSGCYMTECVSMVKIIETPNHPDSKKG